MMNLKTFILLLSFSLLSISSNYACDFTTSQSVIILPDGNHNSAAGFTQTYVLTNLNGDIVAISATGDFGIQNFGSYLAYAINYENGNSPIIPAIGINMSSLITGCFNVSPSISITVCNTSVDSVCVSYGDDIVIAMNPDFNMTANYEEYIVVVDDATGNIISIKPLDNITGSVSYTTDLGTGELQVGNYSVYSLNFENTETLASLGIVIGNPWVGNYGAACAINSNPFPVQVVQCCDTIQFDIDATDLSCFKDFSGSIEILNVTGGLAPYEFSIDNGVNYQLTSTYNTLDTGLYTILVRDSLDCVFQNQVQINQPSALSLSAIVDSVSCFNGNDGSIEITPMGGTAPYTYTWSSSSNTNSLEIGLGIGLVNVSLIDTNLCQVDTMFTIEQPTDIQVTINTIDPTCGNNNGLIDFDIVGGVAPYQYSIDNGANFQAIDSFPNQMAGIYPYIIRDNKGCSKNGNINLSNSNAPVIDSITINDALCFGDSGSVSIFASGGIGTLNYSIDGGAPQVSNQFVQLAPTNYIISIIDSNNCSIDSTITINEPLPLSIPNVITNVSCFGLNDGEITIAPTGGVLPITQVWSTTGTTTTEDSLIAGAYNVTITDSNGCTLDSTFTVTEPVDFNVVITVVDSISCFGAQDGELIAAVNPDPTNYQYNWAYTGGTSLEAGISNLGADTYVVVATNNTTGCADTTQATLNEPIPMTLQLDSNQTICISQVASLNASIGGGATPYTYNWNNGLLNQASQNVNPIITTTYSVYVNDNNGCSSDTQFVVVSVRDSLSLQITKDLVICSGESISISSTASGGDGNYTYTWNNGVAESGFNDAPVTTTDYILILNDGCGTPPVTDTVTVQVNSSPDASFAQIYAEGCSPVALSLDANIKDPLNSYAWIDNNGIILSNLDSLEYSFSDPGCYNLSLVVSNGMCYDTSVFVNAVCVFDYPQAEYQYLLNQDDFFASSVDFSDLSLDAVNYSWTYDGIIFSNDPNPSFEFPETDSIANYLVCLDVENANGCTSQYCDIIQIKGNDYFYIPNTFTPNGDGRNEIFKPILSGYDAQTYEFLIFDRWGEMIFKTEDLDEGWDGFYKGAMVQQDVYVWKITAKIINSGEVENRIGHVNMLK